jgi:hypothetical protein
VSTSEAAIGTVPYFEKESQYGNNPILKGLFWNFLVFVQVSKDIDMDIKNLKWK